MRGIGRPFHRAALEVGPDRCVQGRGLITQGVVGGGSPQRPRRGFLQQAHRVLAADLEALRVDRRETAPDPPGSHDQR